MCSGAGRIAMRWRRRPPCLAAAPLPGWRVTAVHCASGTGSLPAPQSGSATPANAGGSHHICHVMSLRCGKVRGSPGEGSTCVTRGRGGGGWWVNASSAEPSGRLLRQPQSRCPPAAAPIPWLAKPDIACLIPFHMRRGLQAYGTGPPPTPSPPLVAPLVTPRERPLGSVCKHSELAEAPAEGACLHPGEFCRSQAGRHAMAVGGTGAVAWAPPVTRPSGAS